VGVELSAPIVTSEALAAGFTNEAGLGGTTLFMRNLTGLWLLEQAMRQWQEQGQRLTIASLVDDAAAVSPLWAAFDVSSAELVSSEDVLHTVRMQCAATDMALSETPAEVTSCILQSLALTYRRTINQCEQLTGRSVTEVHMIGGGSLNPLLRRLTADASERPLRFGPVEATSLGSLAAQAVAVGHLSKDAAQAALQRSSNARWLTPSNDPTVRRFWQQLDSTVPTPASHP
jgi:rhamnulokinase